MDSPRVDCSPMRELLNFLGQHSVGDHLQPIDDALPAAAVEAVHSTFSEWRSLGYPSLRAKGVFRD